MNLQIELIGNPWINARSVGFYEFHQKYGKSNMELSRSQFVTLKKGQNIKYFPYAFTENGVAMLSSVLNSEGSSD